MTFDGKRILVTGGSGSLGHVLVRRLLSGELGRPARVVVFSRDEAKQHHMRLDFQNRSTATDDIIYQHSRNVLTFRIGDIRDPRAVLDAVRQADIVFHAAAMKQVPTCEYFPYEAVQTNIQGTQHLIDAIRLHDTPVERVVGLSTDKACKPINVMGMTKAIQERMLIEANLNGKTEFLCVRYGNVIASRGSVVPLFAAQIKAGGPLTVTRPDMTRFLLSLETAVDTVLAAAATGQRGETYVPKVPSARVVDIARAMMQLEGRDVPMTQIGVRPGEKLHEVMVSEEECFRTGERDGHYVILPMLPELRGTAIATGVLDDEFSSRHNPIGVEDVKPLLQGAAAAIQAFASVS
jgi:UDP-glucose 4-epimerase